MRGADTENLFSSVKLDDFVPANHPLRPIRTWVNEALAAMDGGARYYMYDEAGHNGKARISRGNGDI